MKKSILIFLSIFIFLSSSIAYSDGGIEDGIASALLGEYESGKILYEYNIDNKIEMASITKIMTYLVTMDQVTNGTVNLKDLVKVSKKAADTKGTSFKLKEGEEIELEILLASIMIVSANDSCVAIAEHVSGTEDEFVNMMNNKAQELGLTQAAFLNSNGLPLKNGNQNRISARDIFELARYVITKYPQILNITKMNRIIMPSRNFEKENTNPLLNEIKEIDGLKTGYTDKAGYCLVSTIVVKESEENQKPFRLIGILMGAKSEEERKNKSLELLQYGVNNYKKIQVLNKDIHIKTIEIDNAKKPTVDILPQRDLYLLVKNGENIEQEIQLDENIKAPIKKGTKVGTIIVKNGEEEENIDLIVNRDVAKAGVFSRIFRFLANLVGL
ncbi:D-alanyl-D-alanine carboxypeptidase family protein [Brassicibacter mesophilus]|uniref:D-alanyl-D-alanine carboxypeptidase family protein n=1 Tax=Brassicibacter mesophilus TaxID=745119 RepID=UPI003D1EEF86